MSFPYGREDDSEIDRSVAEVGALVDQLPDGEITADALSEIGVSREEFEFLRDAEAIAEREAGESPDVWDELADPPGSRPGIWLDEAEIEARDELASQPSAAEGPAEGTDPWRAPVAEPAPAPDTAEHASWTPSSVPSDTRPEPGIPGDFVWNERFQHYDASPEMERDVRTYFTANPHYGASAAGELDALEYAANHPAPAAPATDQPHRGAATDRTTGRETAPGQVASDSDTRPDVTADRATEDASPLWESYSAADATRPRGPEPLSSERTELQEFYAGRGFTPETFENAAPSTDAWRPPAAEPATEVSPFDEIASLRDAVRTADQAVQRIDEVCAAEEAALQADRADQLNRWHAQDRATESARNRTATPLEVS
jgi:hypothetical protein